MSMSEIGHRFVEANGIRMHIAEAGSGPLVLLLHGFPEFWFSWRHQLLALAEAGFHAVAPDQRGYGRTDRPERVEDYTILHLVGDVVDPSLASEPLALLQRELEAAGRDPTTLTTSIGVSLGPGSDERKILELVRAHEAAGVDLLILSLATRPGGEPFDEGIERVASILGLAGRAVPVPRGSRVTPHLATPARDTGPD
jgi:hypothetical protein